MNEGEIQEAVTGGSSGTKPLEHPPAETRTFTLKRKFYQNFSNTPRANNVSNTRVQLNWFNVSYNDQRFYWTPNVLAEVLACSDLIRIKSICFSLSGFQAM